MKYTRKNIFRRLANCLLISKKYMFYSGILSLSVTAVSMIPPYLYKALVDDVMTAGNIKLLYVIIPEMILVYVIKVLFTAMNTYVNKKFAHLTNLEVKKQLMKRFLYRDVSHVTGVDVGKQSGNLEEDSAGVYIFLSSHVVGFVTSFFILVIYLLLMAMINFRLAFISLILVPAAILFMRMVGKNFNQVNRQRFEVESKTRTHLFDTVQKWREIKSNTLEERFASEYDARLEPQRRLNSTWMFYYALRDLFYMIKDEFVMKVLIYFIGGLFIISGDMSIGALLMFISYMENMSSSLESMMKSYSDFAGQRALFDRLFEILEEEYVERGKQWPVNPNITFKNVDFAYAATDHSVLSDFCCEFEYGKKYLIVGKSGEGKSTLVKLLLKINKVQAGDILIGDIPIENIDTQSLLHSIGTVMQENTFFNLSIYENLQLIAPQASREDFHRALEMAGLDDFVDSLPQKMDTVIGERGIKLSGGQKQRLAIARMILHNPRVIILDEATSALDSATESRILDNLQRLFEGRTMIVISHKPLTNYQSEYVMRIGRLK
ncbi:MAG: ABC transporter ATP-binding protein [Lachnospiraceae bacterium]|nr:ABC transporter ATP-binding protein [Lachnospiraceae bacterium]